MNKKDNEIAIEVNHIFKNYGDFQAVKDLSLRIYKDEIFGFLGPNGAGKTTSINMICGLLKPTSGTVKIHNHEISSSNNKLIKSKIGVCPQQIIIWPKLTCFEQLEFMGEMYGMSRSISKVSADNLLEKMGLIEKRNKLANTLSGGMQRRLNIALALVHNPEIIVLDEPEAGLDPQSRVMVREFIKEIAKDKTVILTTHNMDEAERLANRVAIIDHGKLLLVDTPDELKKTIGEGDILELKLLDSSEKNNEKVIALLKGFKLSAKSSDEHILIKHRNLISFIPDISLKLKESEIKIAEMKMRENTLEDVFIHLTGRSLRA
ncbi:ABC transporter ATP-binding protein [Bacteroidota bacterium]